MFENSSNFSFIQLTPMQGLRPTHQARVANAILLARTPAVCPLTGPRLQAHTRAHSPTRRGTGTQIAPAAHTYP